MSETIIKVDNLTKRYIIGHQHQERYTALRDVLTNGAKNLARRITSPFSSHPSDTQEEFFALKDVSFEIKRGERVGIIGRNGAGKSTLLKILSRITEPTSGRIEITGRVASLLEVGTGFHPELTGRENIFLNGAILGMSRVDIKRKFDEIVAFAEVEKFLDTPVKRYSSGMYVRLAFAVAAHLEPEILIVDEVLAVGDAQFQKKCLGRMAEVGEEGRTVLFVSHNMSAIKNLCHRGLLIQASHLFLDDTAAAAINSYVSHSLVGQTLEDIQKTILALPRDPIFRLESVQLKQSDDTVGPAISNGTSLEVEITYSVYERTKGLIVFIRLCDSEENLIFHSIDSGQEVVVPFIKPGRYRKIITIPENFLAKRNYILQIGASIYKVRRCMPNWIAINIEVDQTGVVDAAFGEINPGLIAPRLEWKTTSVEDCRAKS